MRWRDRARAVERAKAFWRHVRDAVAAEAAEFPDDAIHRQTRVVNGLAVEVNCYFERHLQDPGRRAIFAQDPNDQSFK
jgi:hypothetical protein